MYYLRLKLLGHFNPSQVVIYIWVKLTNIYDAVQTGCSLFELHHIYLLILPIRRELQVKIPLFKASVAWQVPGHLSPFKHLVVVCICKMLSYLHSCHNLPISHKEYNKKKHWKSFLVSFTLKIFLFLNKCSPLRPNGNSLYRQLTQKYLPQYHITWTHNKTILLTGSLLPIYIMQYWPKSMHQKPSLHTLWTILSNIGIFIDFTVRLSTRDI